MARPAVAAPTPDTWRGLLPAALRIVEGLRDNGYGPLDMRMGGGTVLMFRFGHRVSKDIDLFIHDAQALACLSPRLNEAAGHGVLEYREQANAIKFLLPLGDVDFIVAGSATRLPPAETLEFEGWRIPLDATAEILAKRLLYRAESFKARDVFDMAVALALDRPAAMEAIRAAASTRPALLRRLRALAPEPAGLLAQALLTTEAGAPYVQGMVETVLRAVTDADAAGAVAR